MYVFAEQNDGRIAFLMALSGLMGAGCNWLALQAREWFKERRKNQVEDAAREDAKEEKIIERLDKERVELREEVRKLDHAYDQLGKELQAALLKAERMVGYLLYYERLLKTNKVDFDPWPREVPVPVGSDVHTPLKDGGQNDVRTGT